MIVSRGKLKEQIQLLYSQFIGKDKFDDNIDKRLVDVNVDQAIAKYIRLQTVENFKAGTKEIPSVNMLEYTLSVSNNQVTLPIFPISLPLDMGVWSVSQDGEDFIPVSNVTKSVMKGTATENLEGQIGYHVVGDKIKFLKPVTGSVIVTLLTVDFDLFEDSDLLPLSPELQLDIINEVLGVISNGSFSQKELNYKDANENNK